MLDADDNGIIDGKKVGKAFKSKNLDAERRRRSKLNSKLFQLRSLVPNITKMSKEATLVDATEYIRNLKEQINELKLELSNSYNIAEENHDKVMHGITVDKSNVNSSSTPIIIQGPGKVDVFQIAKNKYYVKIISKKTPGSFTKLLEAIARHGLDIAEINLLDFSGLTQTVCCIEVKEADKICGVELKRLVMSTVGNFNEN